MNHTIQLTAEQFEALQSGQPITIEPPKPAITKWEPALGNFLISSDLNNSYHVLSCNPEYNSAGLSYQTKSQADSAAKQIRAYARQLAWLAENDDGWVADWSNIKQYKYYVYYEHNNNIPSMFRKYSCYQSQYINTVFMSEANAIKLVQLMNDGIVEF